MKVLASILFFVSSSAFAAGAFEAVTDLDLGFFLTNPKLPWGVDPFLKEPGFASVPAVKDEFRLSGILYSKAVPMAVVNGKTVRTGESIGDRKIAEIGENYVILKKKNSEIELSLPPIGDEDDAIDEDLDFGGAGE